VRLAAGNENERRHLLPLLDALAPAASPDELWPTAATHRARSSRPYANVRSSRGSANHAGAGDPIPAGQRGREVWRGKKRRVKTRDPKQRHRWPVERTNAWLKAMRRINPPRPQTRQLLASSTSA